MWFRPPGGIRLWRVQFRWTFRWGCATINQHRNQRIYFIQSGWNWNQTYVYIIQPGLPYSDWTWAQMFQLRRTASDQDSAVLWSTHMKFKIVYSFVSRQWIRNGCELFDINNFNWPTSHLFVIWFGTNLFFFKYLLPPRDSSNNLWI